MNIRTASCNSTLKFIHLVWLLNDVKFFRQERRVDLGRIESWGVKMVKIFCTKHSKTFFFERKKEWS